MKTVYITRGLPASGKSTWRKSTGLPYVNKDELRLLYPTMTESNIHRMQTTLLEDIMKTGSDCVIDNTSFNEGTVTHYRQIAARFNYTVVMQDFDITMTECINRDIDRPNSVGRDVIIGMALRYGRLTREEYRLFENVYIFDIDGTLSDLTHRRPYLEETPKNWKEFNARIGDDTLKEDVARIYRTLERCNTMICVSGRIESEAGVNMRAITRGWLHKHGINPFVLFMRKARDHRHDDIIKQEIYDTYIKGKMKVHGVFDDRNRVVDMWRKNGLTCLQVAPGDF